MWSVINAQKLFTLTHVNVYGSDLHNLHVNVNPYMKVSLSVMNMAMKVSGSKWHIMSQCVYFAFKTIVLFGVLFAKKHVLLKRNFQMKCFETFYILYL